MVMYCYSIFCKNYILNESHQDIAIQEMICDFTLAGYASDIWEMIDLSTNQDIQILVPIFKW